MLNNYSKFKYITLYFLKKKKKKGKLQIIPLKFKSVWILYFEISEFGFYPLKFEVFRFYTLTFQNLDFTS